MAQSVALGLAADRAGLGSGAGGVAPLVLASRLGLSINHFNLGDTNLTVGDGAGVAHGEDDGRSIHFHDGTGSDVFAVVGQNAGIVHFVGDLDGNDVVALGGSDGQSAGIGLIDSPVVAVGVVLAGVIIGTGSANGNQRIHTQASILGVVDPAVCSCVIDNLHRSSDVALGGDVRSVTIGADTAHVSVEILDALGGAADRAGLGSLTGGVSHVVTQSGAIGSATLGAGLGSSAGGVVPNVLAIGFSSHGVNLDAVHANLSVEGCDDEGVNRRGKGVSDLGAADCLGSTGDRAVVQSSCIGAAVAGNLNLGHLRECNGQLAFCIETGRV